MQEGVNILEKKGNHKTKLKRKGHKKKIKEKKKAQKKKKKEGNKRETESIGKQGLK